MSITIPQLRAALASGLEKSDLIALLYDASIPTSLKIAAFPMVMALPPEAMQKIPAELGPLLDQLENGNLEGVKERLSLAGVPDAWINRIMAYVQSIHQE